MILNRMGLCLLIVLGTGILITLIKPMKEPVVMPVSDVIEVTVSPIAKWFGIGVIVLALTLYVVFW